MGTGTYRLGLVLHPTRDTTPEVRQVLTWAAGLGVEVVALARPGLPPEVTTVGPAELPEVNGVVAIGGDGTILGALRLVARRDVPVLGVNRGTVGFLAEIGPGRLTAALDRLARGDFSVDSRPALRVVKDGGEPTAENLAFNDVALVRLPGQGFGTLRLGVQGQTFAAYRCDALVVATAMGSTAYNYAAGGPLVSPQAEVMCVTPVAPIAGPDRALVVTPREPLEFTVQGARMALEADGAVVAEVGAGDTVHVEYVPGAGRLVRFDPADHGRRTAVKLSLQDLPLPPEELRRLYEADTSAH
ncbi:NAD(+)/NADH kinase [Spirilliplanes yamanashiensis]|uniref:NAD kinase n=1 Tax=Spirilliplanes yamanashiensis TaxID=42233 RepID=A0A8J3Y8E2_9ACTN|nr:NAD(+)/NADH kinase [Spirilliplanes yamanashiensis]MDP9815632.1 NAD+ kinase [Spirilliplanes yamanashiensis]GIJ03886.1 NAD kinase [Spirilliplanes yamanashiensis]